MPEGGASSVANGPCDDCAEANGAAINSSKPITAITRAVLLSDDVTWGPFCSPEACGFGLLARGASYAQLALVTTITKFS